MFELYEITINDDQILSYIVYPKIDSILANFLGLFNVIFFLGNIARIISEKHINFDAMENILKNKYM